MGEVGQTTSRHCWKVCEQAPNGDGIHKEPVPTNVKDERLRNLHHRDANYRGAGRPTIEYLPTIEQAIRSEDTSGRGLVPTACKFTTFFFILRSDLAAGAALPAPAEYGQTGFFGCSTTARCGAGHSIAVRGGTRKGRAKLRSSSSIWASDDRDAACRAIPAEELHPCNCEESTGSNRVICSARLRMHWGLRITIRAPEYPTATSRSP